MAYNMSFQICLKFLLVFYFLVLKPQATSGQNPIQSLVNNYGFEEVRPGKLALIAVGRGFTYGRAEADCNSFGPGVTLFTADYPEDSYWLGERINIEKNQISGSSKFWVGLNSHGFNIHWITGSGYTNYPEVVQVSGNDDETNIYAWAVPDGGNRLKYEFLTPEDEGEAYVCQYTYF